MNITFRQLRVFCAVYELRSFTAAAQTLHITQSAVSKLCAELEHAIGFALFERSTRHVNACDGAADLYSYAQEILGSVRAAQRSLAHLKGLKRGAVAITASPMMMHALLGPVIVDFLSRHPDIRFDLHELATDGSIDYVRTGKADFGLVSVENEDQKLISEVVYRDPMFVIMPPNHELAGKARIYWKDLTRYHHIALRSAYSVHRTLDRIPGAKNLHFNSSVETGTLTTSLQMVRAGLGVTVVPGYVRGFAHQLGLNSSIINDKAGYLHELSLIRRAENKPSIAATVFIQELLPALKRMQALQMESLRTGRHAPSH